MTTSCKTSVGRLVWGHPIKMSQKRDPNTKQLITKQDGSPFMQVSFGVAFPKAEFSQSIWPFMSQEIATGYPSGAPQRFSYKYVDGDGVDGEGKPYSNREGYAGCYVLTVTSNTGFPPAVYKYENGQYRQLAENEIKCGDYVVLDLNFQVNVPTERTHTPSLYVNPQNVLLVGYGAEIVSGGVDPTQSFGAAPQYQLPPGASMQPVAPQTSVGMPGAPQQPPMHPQQPGAPQGNPMQYPGATMPGGAATAPTMAPGGYAQQPANPAMGYPSSTQGYQQPPMQPQQPAPGGMPGQMPPPAHDFVRNAGQMPGAPQGYQQPQQPAPGGMPGMPGQMPPR